jgi:hypothetical protein
MTAVIRYVTNTINGEKASSEVNSTGSDYQLVAFSISLENDIPNDTEQVQSFPLLTWTGAGTIKQVMNVDIDAISLDTTTPTHLDILIDKNVIFCFLKPEEEIKATATIRMLVLIGNY